MKTRLANNEDMAEILKMSADFWQYTDMDVPFDPGHAGVFLQMSIDQGLCVVSESEDGIVGFICALSSPSLGNPSYIIATELAWWINTESRGKMAGVRLLRHLESLCIEKGIRRLHMLFMESSMPEQVRGLYEALGYSLHETTYLKVFDYGTGDNSFNSGRGSCGHGGGS